MTDLHARIERLIAHLEEENRALQSLLRQGHSLEEADRVLQGLQAEPPDSPRVRPRRDAAEGEDDHGLHG